MLLRLLNPSMALSLVSTQLGVPREALSLFATNIGGALAPHAGSGFSPMSSALAVFKGDFSSLRVLYDTVLADKASRPALVALVAKWLQEHDNEGIALALFSALNKAPLIHMGSEATSVEAFLEDSFLPLLDEVFKTINCDEGHPLAIVAPNIGYCHECDIYKDI